MLDRVSLGKIMKLLFLAENPEKIADNIRNSTDAKVISEQDVINDTFWRDKKESPLYSEWLVERVKGLSQVYTYKRPVVFVLDQKHQTAVAKIPHDASIRVHTDAQPKRLSQAVSYDSDLEITEDQINPDFYQQFFS